MPAIPNKDVKIPKAGTWVNLLTRRAQAAIAACRAGALRRAGLARSHKQKKGPPVTVAPRRPVPGRYFSLDVKRNRVAASMLKPPVHPCIATLLATLPTRSPQKTAPPENKTAASLRLPPSLAGRTTSLEREKVRVVICRICAKDESRHQKRGISPYY